MNSRSPTVIVLALEAVSGALVGGLIVALITIAAMRYY
jgi:hypothetical protein